MLDMSVYDRRRVDSSQCLPSGWRREEVIRRKGLLAGKVDVYYYGPDGQRISSKAQMTRLLGSKFDMTSFDYQSGRVLPGNLHRRLRQDAVLSLPIRQTASIFKQPVTIVSNHPDSKTRNDLRHGVSDQPRQLFWEKRLEGLFACDENGDKMSRLQLPNVIQGIAPELISTENLLHSIAAALHLGNQPITGQSASRAQLQRNPGVCINADQPPMQAVVISDHDVQKQEMRVLEARRRLQRAMACVDDID